MHTERTVLVEGVRFAFKDQEKMAQFLASLAYAKRVSNESNPDTGRHDLYVIETGVGMIQIEDVIVKLRSEYEEEKKS